MRWLALLGAVDPSDISPDDYMGPLASTPTRDAGEHAAGWPWWRTSA